MSENKKYFYLKLKDNFFDNEEMKILESQTNGIEYQNLYLKLCLLSVKNQGKLIFKDAIPYDLDMLASIFRMNIDTIKVGIEILNKIKLLEVLENGVMYMSDIQALIGHSSTEGERVKAYRERIKNDKVYDRTRMLQNRSPELELKTDIKIELDKDIDTIKEVLTLLNLKANKQFTLTKTYKKLIKTRLNEGYTIDQFKQVINTKCEQWLKDEKMNEYLRPQTLFSTKFDSYLNTKSNIKNNFQDHAKYQNMDDPFSGE